MQRQLLAKEYDAPFGDFAKISYGVKHSRATSRRLDLQRWTPRRLMRSGSIKLRIAYVTPSAPIALGQISAVYGRLGSYARGFDLASPRYNSRIR